MRRLELQISDRDYQILEALKQRSGAASLAETIRNAINSYDWLTDKVQAGYTIFAESPTDHRKVEPILPIRSLREENSTSASLHSQEVT